MKKRNLFKLAALTAVFALGSMFANAQVVTGNIPVQNQAVMGQDSGYVKVIDNKGTVKYIQTANGLTTFTNTAPSGGIVTTFQLGGTLNSNTYIDVNGKEFGLVGLDTIETEGVNYELVVTDPATGNLRRLAFDGLITAGRVVYPMTADVIIIGATHNIPVPGIPLAYEKVYVYRNGAKLLASTDYIISSNTVTLNISTDLPALYNGDIIEVHYVK